MTEREVIDQLNQLADELFASESPKFAGRLDPPFSLSRESTHLNKAEFDADLKVAISVLKHLDGIIKVLGNASDVEPDSFGRTQVAVDKAIRNETRRRKVRGGSSRDLAVQNIRETGFFDNSCDILYDMRLAFHKSVLDLKAQQELFWSASNRPPDHYARIISLRFARLYKKETGKMPTNGTSSLGNHPSTDFGRALHKVFKILTITTTWRIPGDWVLIST